MLSKDRNDAITSITQRLEYLFAVMSLAAGAMAIFLEKNWFKTIDDSWKVPVYGMMGATYSFVLIYALIEVAELTKESLGYFAGQAMASLRKVLKCLWGKQASTPKEIYVPLVVINLQYLLLLVSSLVSGGMFGTLFGIIDIEN